MVVDYLRVVTRRAKSADGQAVPKMRRCSDGAEKKTIDDALGSFAEDAAQQPMERAMRPKRRDWPLLKGGSRNKQEKKRLRTHKAGAP